MDKYFSNYENLVGIAKDKENKRKMNLQKIKPKKLLEPLTKFV